MHSQWYTKRLVFFNGFFWWSIAVKTWIQSPIHCIQLIFYSLYAKAYWTMVNLLGIRAKYYWSYPLQILPSCFKAQELQKWCKQAGLIKINVPIFISNDNLLVLSLSECPDHNTVPPLSPRHAHLMSTS